MASGHKNTTPSHTTLTLDQYGLLKSYPELICLEREKGRERERESERERARERERERAREHGHQAWQVSECVAAEFWSFRRLPLCALSAAR